MSAHPVKIRLQGVRKSFGSNHVLNGLDLDVLEGKSLVVIGGSGTGKSVLLKCILGLLRPDAGSVTMDGQDMTRLSARAQEKLASQFGMLFQGAALFDSLKIWENVSFRLLNADRTPRKLAREMALNALKRVNLPERVAELRPAELSGGMQKRVGLARAIVAKPKVLFFDEPTTGLDPITADVINRLIREQVTDLGATAISITHDMISARYIADEVAMIFDGKIIWKDNVGALDHSGNAYVEQFVSGSENGPIQVISG